MSFHYHVNWCKVSLLNSKTCIWAGIILICGGSQSFEYTSSCANESAQSWAVPKNIKKFCRVILCIVNRISWAMGIYICLIHYEDGEKRYILHPKRAKIDDAIVHPANKVTRGRGPPSLSLARKQGSLTIPLVPTFSDRFLNIFDISVSLCKMVCPTASNPPSVCGSWKADSLFKSRDFGSLKFLLHY